MPLWDGISSAERIIIRNQRLIMLAIAAMYMKSGGSGSEYYPNMLINRVKEMDANLEWIATPNEHI